MLKMKVVSTLPNVVETNVEIYNVNSTLFNVVNSNVGVHNVDLILNNFKNNVETTLKYLLG